MSRILCFLTVIVPVGCSDPGEGRVIPDGGVRNEEVSYKPERNPVEQTVDIPKVTLVDNAVDPKQIPSLSPQPSGFPVVFQGKIDNLKGGVVVVRFYRKGTRDESGRGTVTNEFSATTEPDDEGDGCRYVVRGKTPQTVEDHEIDISVSFPESFKKSEDGSLPALIERVIASGAMTTESRE